MHAKSALHMKRCAACMSDNKQSKDERKTELQGLNSRAHVLTAASGFQAIKTVSVIVWQCVLQLNRRTLDLLIALQVSEKATKQHECRCTKCRVSLGL